MKFYFSLLYVVSFIIRLEAENQSLQLVHVFFRHGSRTPELKDTYPTDPYTAETFYPMGWGALTNKGKQSSFKLGQTLRKRYNEFLGDTYVPETVKAVSTDYDRTKMTVLLVLAGLFPPSVSQKWDDEIPWMPIPYHYDKDTYDFTLRRPTHYCPTYFKELTAVLSSDEALREIKANRNLFKFIEEHTNSPMNELIHGFQIYQTLNAEDVMNLTLPEWAQTIYPEQIHAVAAKQCMFENYNSVLKRLNGGRMLGKIIEQMVDKSNKKLSPPDRKIYLYSGHENNVINILATLNMFHPPHVPRYTAAVIVELHYVEERGYGVKVLYQREANKEPEVQKLEGCEVLCPLNDFIRITEPHVPVNYTEECHSNINLD